MVNIVRQDSNTTTQEYDFCIGKDRHWKIKYNSFSCPSEVDRERGAVDSSVVFEEMYPTKSDHGWDTIGSFHDIIYQTGKKVGINMGEKFGYSPVFDGWSKLEANVKNDIIKGLSPEAKDLLEKGLEYYDSIKKGS